MTIRRRRNGEDGEDKEKGDGNQKITTMRWRSGEGEETMGMKR
jgi:hypothetical protein